MGSNVRALAVFVCAAGIATLIAAAGSPAGTTQYCSSPDPHGRVVCVTAEDTDGVSPSGPSGSGARAVDVVAYQYYKLSVQNNGGSALTNGSVKVVLSDVVPGGTVDSSALYVGSASTGGCSLASSSAPTVVCPLSHLAAGGSAPTITLVFRTSTTPGVTATTAHITTAFEEGTKGSNGASPATFTFTESTSLERDPEHTVSWSPSGQNVHIGTSPAFDTQFSNLAYRVPAGKAAFSATLAESHGSVCAPGVSCFGEVITTDLSAAENGTFSAANPFHLKTTESLDVVPGGDAHAIVMSHRRDNGQFEIVSRRCTSSPPSATEHLPCLKVTNDHTAKLLVVDVWAAENGGWMIGG